jgi:transcriptional regulator with XRE-family HTH domain
MPQTRPIPPLREARKNQGLGLRATARLIPMDHAQLSRIERGLEGITLDALARLATVLGDVTLARLLAPYTLPPEMRSPAVTGKKASAMIDDADPN